MTSITLSICRKCNDINNNHRKSFTEVETLHNGTAVDVGCQAEKRECVSEEGQFTQQK